jgi:hypothetical protein
MVVGAAPAPWRALQVLADGASILGARVRVLRKSHLKAEHLSHVEIARVRVFSLHVYPSIHACQMVSGTQGIYGHYTPPPSYPYLTSRYNTCSEIFLLKNFFERFSEKSIWHKLSRKNIFNQVLRKKLQKVLTTKYL